MTSMLPWSYIYTETLLDKESRLPIRWESDLPKVDHRFEKKLGQQLENQFLYPSLDELRLQFQSTGLYSNEQIDEIIKAYERLPKYKTQRNSAARGTKRS